MKHVAPLLLAGAFALSACNPETSPTSPDLAPSYARAASGNATYIVGFSGKRTGKSIAADAAAKGGKLEWFHEGASVAVVSGIDESAAKGLRGAHLVARDELIQLSPATEAAVSETAADVSDTPLSQANPATAFFYSRQWHMRAIFAQHAWAAGKLGEGVTVAILDTGIDSTHVDLKGLVIPGTSFVPGEVSTQDFHYHGTHVASTVASKAAAIAGVTSKTKLMPVKVLSASGGGFASYTLAGILYASDNGADVINMSLGGAFLKRGGGGEVGGGGLVSLIAQVTAYAARSGVVVVVAAGNDAADITHNIYDGTHYPSLYSTYCDAPNVVCVSATGPSTGGTNGPWTNVDAFASYSNFGRSAIDVAAPGGTAAGYVWGACSRASLAIPVCRTGNYVLGAAGTSMAAPHVSGLAALLVEQLGKNNAAAIRDRLVDTADDLGLDGVDPYYGKGRINAASALGVAP